MGEPLADYVVVDREYRVAEDALRPMIKIIMETARRLEYGPENFYFKNVQVSVPPKLALSRSSPADAREWPDAEKLQKALSDWHNAYEKAVTAWERINPEDKGALRAPSPPSSSVRHPNR